MLNPFETVSHLRQELVQQVKKIPDVVFLELLLQGGGAVLVAAAAAASAGFIPPAARPHHQLGSLGKDLADRDLVIKAAF